MTQLLKGELKEALKEELKEHVLKRGTEGAPLERGTEEAPLEGAPLGKKGSPGGTEVSLRHAL